MSKQKRGSPPEHKELYETLQDLEAALRPHLRLGHLEKNSLTQVLFRAIGKSYLLGMAVGVSGEKKRTRGRRKGKKK